MYKVKHFVKKKGKIVEKKKYKGMKYYVCIIFGAMDYF